jgi:hypothetical protein
VEGTVDSKTQTGRALLPETFSHFVDNRFTRGGEISGLRSGRALLPEIFSHCVYNRFTRGGEFAALGADRALLSETFFPFLILGLNADSRIG